MAKPLTKQKAVEPRSQRPGAKPAPKRKAKPRMLRRTRRALILSALAALALVALFAIFFGSIFKTAPALSGGAIGTLNSADYHSLVFSPDDPNVAFFGSHNGIRRTGDGGRTWQSFLDKSNFDAMGMAITKANPKQFYIAGHDIFQTSADGGSTWQPIASNLPGTDLHGFDISPTDPRRLFVFVAGYGAFQSVDGGQTWQSLANQLPGDTMSLAAGGGDPATLFVTGMGSMGSGLLRSTDGGKSWAPSTNGLGAGGAQTVKVDPTSPKTVYAGGSDGLYKSADGGTSWSKLPFPAGNVALIGLSPIKPGVVLVVAINNRQGLVYRSEDGGATWGSK